MNKRVKFGMIFIPLLCLLFALLGFTISARAKENVLPIVAAYESVTETTKTPVQIGGLNDLVYRYTFTAPSPSEPAETNPPIEKWVCPLTDEEVELIALLTMAEADGESEYGQRLVIDTVLNRVDSEHFPNTVHDVIYQKNQYSSMTGKRVTRCWVKEELCELVRSELKERTDYDVVFFRTRHYHSFGVPLFQVGAHYFSKYG